MSGRWWWLALLALLAGRWGPAVVAQDAVDDVASLASSTTPMTALLASSTAPTTPLAQPPDGADTPVDAAAAAPEPPEQSTGTTVVSTSSTKIDATTVVLFSTTFSSTPVAVQPTATTTLAPPSDENRSTTEAAQENPPSSTSTMRPTVDTGWRTTTSAPRKPPPRPRPTMPPAANATNATASCDFGLYPTTTLCGWKSLHAGRSPSSPRWRPGSGMATNWIGGPRADGGADGGAEGAREPAPVGGYAFVETSEGAGAEAAGDRAFLLSPQLAATGAQGSCLFFMYSLAGLSARGLRVLLARNESSRTVLRELWYTTPPHVPDDGWLHAQLLYSEPQPHRLVVEASCTPAADPSRAYRGHVALDAVALVPGEACPLPLSCSFAAGLCRWTNARQGDDFDWSMGRGSALTFTGPAAPADSWVEPQHGNVPKQQLEGRGLGDDDQDVIADLESAVVGDEGGVVVDPGAADQRPHPGGYVYIDSAYPRRPGDIARLESEQLPASDPLFPSCLRFWFHMFGVDVGTLRIILASSGGGERDVWRLAGDAGNAWFRGAVTLAEPQPFRVVIEATVGAVGMSDIAVDNISLDPGPCPVSPQVAGARRPVVAAPRRVPRMPPDCSMEVDECGWRGMAATSLWARLPVASLPPALQRRPHGPGGLSRDGAGLRNDFFLGLQMPASPGGSSPSPSTTLVSLPITSTDEPLCLAFWYLVHEPSPTGAMSTGLGALRVAVKEAVKDARDVVGEVPAGPVQPATLWALYNSQGPAWRPARVPLPANWTFIVELEGEWGPGQHAGILAVDDIVLYHARCPGLPSSALSSPADCSFSADTCGWWNGTAGSTTGRSAGWQHASGQHRPARLSDNTFRGPGGYVFFDMFSLSKVLRRARLESPALDAGEPVCFSFWFAAFGQVDSTLLRVVRVDQDHKIPEITVWQLSARGMDTARPQWMSAQTTLSANSAFSVVLEGEANNGGFAVDDVRVRPGTCQTRPAGAKPTTATTPTR